MANGNSFLQAPMGFFTRVLWAGLGALIVNMFFISSVPEFLQSFVWMLFGILTALFMLEVIRFPQFFIFSAVSTSPFWVLGLANTAFTTLFHLDEATASSVTAIASPAMLAVASFVYWYMSRWQELSRTAIQPIVLATHTGMFVYVALFMTFTQTVAAWGFSAIAISLLVNSFIANGAKNILFSAALFSITTGLGLFFFA